MIWVYSILIVLGAFYLGSSVGVWRSNRRWEHVIQKHLPGMMVEWEHVIQKHLPGMMVELEKTLTKRILTKVNRTLADARKEGKLK